MTLPEPAPMTGADALRLAADTLTRAGIAEAREDARRLLAWALDTDRARLVTLLAAPLDEAAQARFAAAIAERADRKPVARIIGARMFWGRRFALANGALDPRPETETLIAAALDLPWTRVLDIGVGSGAILLTLLAERPHASGLGVDASHDAVHLAQQNARRLRVSERVQLVNGCWFPESLERFDLIASNPPYIPDGEIAGLAPEVRNWDPCRALAGGPDGLDAYRAILGQAAAWLTQGGHILLEHGPGQAPAIAELADLHRLGPVESLPDLDGRPRIMRIGPTPERS